MIVERDWYGSYSTCISCGFVHEMVSSPAIDLLDDEDSLLRLKYSTFCR